MGRFFARDPLTGEYPFYSPYQFSGNRVIDMIELEGAETGELKNVGLIQVIFPTNFKDISMKDFTYKALYVHTTENFSAGFNAIYTQKGGFKFNAAANPTLSYTHTVNLDLKISGKFAGVDLFNSRMSNPLNILNETSVPNHGSIKNLGLGASYNVNDNQLIIGLINRKIGVTLVDPLPFSYITDTGKFISSTPNLISTNFDSFDVSESLLLKKPIWLFGLKIPFSSVISFDKPETPLP